MNSLKPKFNIKDRPDFFKELNSRVNAYFNNNNLSKKAAAW